VWGGGNPPRDLEASPSGAAREALPQEDDEEEVPLVDKVSPEDSLWKSSAQKADGGSFESAFPEETAEDEPLVPEQSDFLESTADYVGADTGFVLSPEREDGGTGLGEGGGEEAPPFEKLRGASLKSPYGSGIKGGKFTPETSTAVIVNYLDDRDDSLIATDAEAGDLDAADDLDLDLLEYSNNQVLRAKPMIPVPKEPIR
jgi:hypothetical protein